MKNTIQNIGSPFQRTFTTLKEIIPIQLNTKEQEHLTRRILELFVYVIKADNEVNPREIDTVTNIIRELYGHHVINDFMSIVKDEKIPELENICEDLQILGMSERETIVKCLFITCFADNEFCLDEQRTMIEIANYLDINTDRTEFLEKEALKDHNSRMGALNSSTGLIAAIPDNEEEMPTLNLWTGNLLI